MLHPQVQLVSRVHVSLSMHYFLHHQYVCLVPHLLQALQQQLLQSLSVISVSQTGDHAERLFWRTQNAFWIRIQVVTFKKIKDAGVIVEK